MCMHVHRETRGPPQVLLLASHPLCLRHSLSLDLRLADCSRLAGHGAPGTLLVLQVYAVTSGVFYGSGVWTQVLTFAYQALCSLSHLPSILKQYKGHKPLSYHTQAGGVRQEDLKEWCCPFSRLPWGTNCRASEWNSGCQKTSGESEDEWEVC